MEGNPTTGRTSRLIDALLEARHLQVVYPVRGGSILAVNDFSLSIRKGEFVGLVGESGSGKSTAALALLGLVRGRGEIVKGEVIFLGEDLLSHSEERLRTIRGNEIGLVVQNPGRALNPLLRVGHQIANVYRAHHSVSKQEALDRAKTAMKDMEIPDSSRRVRAYPYQLSGGMAQRVLIAMATINEPKLLVADEPTTGLDVTVQAQILDLLRSKVNETGSSVLFVTHDLGVVAHYCDRVAVMQESRLVEEAPVTELFAQPKHPYTQQLIASAPERAKGMGPVLK